MTFYFLPADILTQILTFGLSGRVFVAVPEVYSSGAHPVLRRR